MVDINRVEVLRGPHGTLYGSGSMGGTLRIIPNEPDTEDFFGKISAGYSNTSENGDDNSMLQGTVNVPIIEGKFAVRATGYTFENSGVIKNVVASDPVATARLAGIPGLPALSDKDDVARDQYDGFRIAALFTPTDKLRITGTYSKQVVDQDGVREIDDSLGGNYSQARLPDGISGPEFVENEISITNLIVEYDFDFGTLLSSTSDINQSHVGDLDFTGAVGLPTGLLSDTSNDAFIQELRFTSALDGPFQFLLGWYYQKVETQLVQDLQWTGTQPDIFGGAGSNLVHAEADRELKQQAVFGELSYELTEKLRATVGVRSFTYDEESVTTANGLFIGPVPTNVSLSGKESGETFKVNLSYDANDDLMMYAQWAEGFRNGYAHTIVPPGACDVDGDGLVDGTTLPSSPPDVQPDFLDSYEIGAKWTSEDKRVQASGALFYIDWSGIPVTVVPPCNFGITLNAGSARSVGGELEVQAILGENFLVNAGISVIDAELTESISDFGLSSGDKLPGSSDLSVSLGMEYAFTLADNDAFARVDYSYVGQINGPITSTNGLEAGEYSIIDLSLGGSIKNTSAEIYVKNLFNDDSISWILSSFDAFVVRNRPRTIGVTLRYQF